MLSRSGPIAAMRSWTAFWAPEPRASMVITAPTPMMMPRAVSSDRSLLARIAWSATLKISSSSIGRAQRLRVVVAPVALAAAGGHELGPPLAHRRLLGRRELLAAHRLAEQVANLLGGVTARQRDLPAVRRRHHVGGGLGGVAPGGLGWVARCWRGAERGGALSGITAEAGGRRRRRPGQLRLDFAWVQGPHLGNGRDVA